MGTHVPVSTVTTVQRNPLRLHGILDMAHSLGFGFGGGLFFSSVEMLRISWTAFQWVEGSRLAQRKDIPMSIFPAETPNARPNNAGRGNTNPDFKPSEYWVNIGFEVDVPVIDPSTGIQKVDENGQPMMEKDFISLPMNLPLDNIEPMALGNGKNADWTKKVQAKNAILAQLKAACPTLAPGEGRITTLQCQLFRKAAPAAEPAVGENPLLDQIGMKLIG